jgi:hypothetical protein
VARQKVLGEEHLSGATLEPSQVDSLALEGHPTFGEATDFTDWNEQIATLDPDNHPDDWRMGVVAETRDQVLDASNPVTVRIEDRPVQERREVENFGHTKPLTTM